VATRRFLVAAFSAGAAAAVGGDQTTRVIWADPFLSEAEYLFAPQCSCSRWIRLRQPSAAVAANANEALRLLAGSALDLDQARAALKRIINDGQHVNEVIDNIRLMFNTDPPTKALLDVNVLIREVIRLVQDEIESQRVSVRTELMNELSSVPANPVQLRQVIMSLITNAVDAMHNVADRHRVLRIKTEIYERSNLVITVEDSGTGIDPKNLSSIFEPFFTTKSDRMGMGLAICWSIVANHGGRMAVANGQPHGSIFQVFLPRGPSF
jgi:signal transduction histidine kinase